MKIEDLPLEAYRITLQKNNPNLEVSYIHTDSRKISQGDIYCVNESFADRTPNFLEDALSKKANAVLIKKGSKYSFDTNKFEIVMESEDDPETIVGYLASALKNHPSKFLKVVAVTGTNGKTSVTHILYDLLTKENKKCGIIGTIQTYYDGKSIETGYTTPDAPFLHEIFYDMKMAGVEYVFMEASSHGLKLGRLNGVEFYAAIFTNLTVDHLDFHINMEDYRNSKLKLFELLEKSSVPEKFGIVYKDFPGGLEFVEILKSKNCSYPIYILGGENFELKNIQITSFETQYIIVDIQKKVFRKIQTNLLGNFNAINSALAYIACEKFGFSSDRVAKNLTNLKSVPGRFQKIYDNSGEKLAIVDYAHTPDALENVIQSARELTQKRLVTLFGCGGDRDKTKRPLMGEIAEKYSDLVIVTSDNPRTEDQEKIIDDIVSGFSKNYTNFYRISDRSEAIQKGVKLLKQGEILLVCGKGHEDYQILGKKKIYFSDEEEIKKAFRKN
ncbi:MAG: UDP-N-acetylmuramoyl-L-alanyl-D-glutamate--2,6-diaminopimelate ligase [Leptospiraceae bacterium]|nr:UDP-N-acetylmuramoyl-L-alanyl-D-glutamate--2,6-diaminopimelate ligase [Leptospiraceae bacterium]MCK6379678.1 UDP-N-acetylmuramoyl-L-alanyl-D-glutamate--2,6-diaminopimelate ligase [Leptospiraceae bacterium]NUM41762.1 UDP-N-acetylmuramoyl-L-alanyl-D-glutamate--2,6-diaminopimelate ligase [Leptospiraceae bacterium]